MTWTVLEPLTMRNQEAAITISKDGRLAWTSRVDEAMGRPGYIELLYDQKGARLGIRPAQDGHGLRRGKRERQVSARGTLQAAGVWDKLEAPIIARPALLNDDGIWSISIRPDLPLKRRKHHDAYLDGGDDGDDDDE